jgi:20S proteasome subunit alpha 5
MEPAKSEKLVEVSYNQSKNI